MREIKTSTYKGTRILLGNEKRLLIDTMVDQLIKENLTEINIPIIQFQEIFKDKVGAENNNIMYNFKDRGNRDICLAPEYTSVIQLLSDSFFKYEKDLSVFYVQECFRGEKPQSGRYRQFTQLGVEIINPTIDYTEYLIDLAEVLISTVTTNYVVSRNVKRGLDYYKDGCGFEISCEDLGTSKQVCGGGQYSGGIGFAIGIDRLLQLKYKNKE